MAWQLIYTSAPRGLVAGRSGFCTVARHREIRDGLVSAIERFSQYDRSGRGVGSLNPVVYAHRIVRLGGASYHIISYTGDAGADYTGRTNHLAHHLICEPHELANAPSPAEVLRQMTWRSTWAEAPRYLGPEDVVDLQGFSRTAALPAQTWQALTGDAGCAALPLESGALAGCYWLYPSAAGEQYLLPLFAESLLLADGGGRNAEKLWQVPFTTYLQSTDHAADFFWRGCWEGSPGAIKAQGARQNIDLTRPRELRAPASQAAELARTGWKATYEVPEVARAAADAPSEAADTGPDRPDESELDLDALLARADDASESRRRSAGGASTITSASGGYASDSNREYHGARKLPLGMIIAAGIAVVVCGALAMSLVMWRDARAERIRGQLTQARNGGDFTSGAAIIKDTWGIYRSYEPLKIEIERTEVAAELDALKQKSPEEASQYLLWNTNRLSATAIREEPQINDRLEKIGRWCKAYERGAELHKNVAGETFADPSASVAIKKKFGEEEKAISGLDKPYRPSIDKQLAETKRLYVTRRLDILEQAIKAGNPSPAPEVVTELRNDADHYAVAQELRDRILTLYRPKSHPDAPPPPAPNDKPAATAPPVVTDTAPQNALGLPTISTYLAVATTAGFDVRHVQEMQGGTVIPADGKWLLFRNPAPVFNPQSATPEECSIQEGKKIYDSKSNPLCTLQSPQLVTKVAWRETFLLRFTPTATGTQEFQILFLPSDQNTVLLQLPRNGAFVRTHGNLVQLDPNFASKLKLLQSATDQNNVLLLHSSPEGLNALIGGSPMFDKLELDPSPEIKRCEEEVQKIQRKKESEENALKGLKELQTGLDCLKTALGRRLFEGVTRKEPDRNKKGEQKRDGDGNLKYRDVPVIPEDSPWANLEGYLKDHPKVNKQHAGEAIERYISELLFFLSSFVDNETHREQLRRVDSLMQKEFEFSGTQEQKTEKIWQIWSSELPKTSSVKPGEPAKDNAEIFYANWLKIFNEKDRTSIRAYLAWSGSDIDKLIQDWKRKLADSNKKLADLEANIKRFKGDLSGLAPFSIDWEFRNPAPVRTVKLIEFLEEQPANNPAGAK